MHTILRQRLCLVAALIAVSAGIGAASSAAQPAPPDSAIVLPPSQEGPLNSRVRLSLFPELEPGGNGIAPTTTPLPHKGFNTVAPTNQVALTFRYNRVEGMQSRLNLHRLLERENYLPAFEAELGYAFAAKRGQYAVGFEQPVAPRNKLTLGAEGFRRNLPFFYEQEAVSGGENTASALFFHRDYWDWHEVEGVRAFVGVHPSPFMHFSAGVVQQDESSLGNNADWSVFRQTSDFRINPPAREGQFRAFELSAEFDNRPRNHEDDPSPREGWGAITHRHRVVWERGDGGLGGDFDMWRWTADLRSYFRLSARQELSARVVAGSGNASTGGLSPQRQFALGGLGTLRGHNYRELRGDRVALLNLEYAFAVTGKGRALFFADAGTAWSAGSLTQQRVPVDVGAGYRLGEKGLTVLVARSLSRQDSGVKVQLRLRESF